MLFHFFRGKANMVRFTTEIRTDGAARASIYTIPKYHGAKVDIDSELIWSAAALLTLAEALKGAALVLRTNAILSTDQ